MLPSSSHSILRLSSTMTATILVALMLLFQGCHCYQGLSGLPVQNARQGEKEKNISFLSQQKKRDLLAFPSSANFSLDTASKNLIWSSSCLLHFPNFPSLSFLGAISLLQRLSKRSEGKSLKEDREREKESVSQVEQAYFHYDNSWGFRILFCIWCGKAVEHLSFAVSKWLLWGCLNLEPQV